MAHSSMSSIGNLNLQVISESEDSILPPTEHAWDNVAVNVDTNLFSFL